MRRRLTGCEDRRRLVRRLVDLHEGDEHTRGDARLPRLGVEVAELVGGIRTCSTCVYHRQRKSPLTKFHDLSRGSIFYLNENVAKGNAKEIRNFISPNLRRGS